MSLDEKELKYVLSVTDEASPQFASIKKQLLEQGVSMQDFNALSGKSTEAVQVQNAAVQQLSQTHAGASRNLRILGIDFGDAEKAESKFMQGIASGVLGVPLFAGAALAAGFAVIQLGEGLANAAKETIAWDADLVRIQNNVGITDAQTVQMGQDIQNLYAQGGASLQGVEQGFQHVENFGNRAADATKITSASFMSAVSSGGDFAKTADLVAGTLHKYNLEADQALRVTDILHLGAQQSDATFEEFAGHMDRASSVAAQFNIPLEQVAGSVASLTRNFTNAAGSQTQFVTMLEKIAHPTAQAADELARIKKLTGVDLPADFSATGLSSKGLIGVINDLRTAFAKMGLTQAQIEDETGKLVTAQRGGLGLATLTTIGYQDLVQNLQAYEQAQKSASVTQESYNRYLGTTQAQLDRLGANFDVAKIKAAEFGLGIADGVGKFEMWLADLATGGQVTAQFGEVATKTMQDVLDAAKSSSTGVKDTWAVGMDGVISDMGAGEQAVESLGNKYAALDQDVAAHMDDFQQFVDGSLSSASRSLQKHSDDWENLKANLTNDITQLQAKYDEYDNAAKTASAGASGALIAHRNQVAIQMAAIKGELLAGEQQWADYYAAAGGSLIQRFNQAKVGLTGVQDTADLAAANAKAAHEIANNTDKTKSATEAAQAHARAATEDARATLAQDQVTLEQAQALAGLTGRAEDYASVGKAKAQVARDEIAVTSASTKEIQANTNATIANNNAAAAKKGAAADKKADTAADAGRRVEEQINEARATEAVTKARQDLDAITKQYTTDIEKLQTQEHQLEQTEKQALAPLEHNWKMAAQAEQIYSYMSQAGLAALDEKIYQDEQAIYKLGLAWKEALETAKSELASTQAYLAAIDDYTKRTDQDMDRQAHDLQQQANAVDDEMETARRAEAALNDELDQEQRARQALADLWEGRILPNQLRLNALKEQERQLDAGDKLHEEAVGIQNLAAQLATATGARRTQLQYEIDGLRQRHALHAEEETLQQRLTKLEADRDAALRTADAQIKATQARVQATRDEGKAIAARAQVIADEQKLLDRQRTEFDYQQGQKRQAAEEDQKRAQDQLDRLQAQADAAVKPYQDEEAAIAHLRTVKAHDDGIEDQRLKDNAARQKGYFEFVRDEVYQPQIDKIKETIVNLQDQEKAAVKPYQDVLDFVTKHKTDLDAAYKLIEEADTATDKGATRTTEMANAVTLAQNVINDLVPQLPPLGTALQNSFNSGKTAAQNFKTQGLDPVATAHDRTQTGTMANLVFAMWDETKDTSYKAQSDTSLHDAGNAMLVYHNGAVLDFRDLNAVAQTYLNTLKDISTYPTNPSGGGTPPHRAEGGPVSAGYMYTVGERGPETFVAPQSGYIYPHEASRFAPGAGGGGVGRGVGDLHVHVAFGGQPIVTKGQISYTVRRAIHQAMGEYETGTGHGGNKR